MNGSDNVKMTINIGGEHLSLTVSFNSQDDVRDAEKAASQLYQQWRAKWPTRSDKEIMAMVAYQFAFFYRKLLGLQQNAIELVNDCSSEIEGMIEDIRANGIL